MSKGPEIVDAESWAKVVMTKTCINGIIKLSAKDKDIISLRENPSWP